MKAIFLVGSDSKAPNRECMIIKKSRRLIRDLAYKMGYEITPKVLTDGNDYHEIKPTSTYSPWYKDKLFIETYEKIKPYTLVDVYRYYELWSLVQQSSKLSGGIIEIGVFRGGSGALIAT
ncbi:MAG: hypothetical protein GKR87_14390 [Kiritimatiellae bacterium]|nr:hypothetical protein [Kiritimatiellia bacterium]